MRVFAGTRTSFLVVGGAFVLFAVVAVAAGAIYDVASARADRHAQATALAATRLLNETTVANVHRSVVVPLSFRGSTTYGDGGCDEYELGCWTTTEAPMLAATELKAAVTRAGFGAVRGVCGSSGGFCEVTALVGQVRISYWVTASKTAPTVNAPSETTEVAGFVAP
jgi:hypothetical protein